MEEILAAVNKDVRGILDDALAHGENPRLVALIRAVITLTNSEEDNKAQSTDKAKEDANAKMRADLAAQVAALQQKMDSLG